MKPVDQQIIDSSAGDCFSASLASVLELDIAEVPKFARDHADDVEMWNASNRWLKSRGIRCLTMAFENQAALDRTYFDTEQFCVLGSTSPRSLLHDGKPLGHAVVGLAKGWGIKVVHDPHPSRAGLAPEGWRWAHFFFPPEASR